jgi:hypothetical protein
VRNLQGIIHHEDHEVWKVLSYLDALRVLRGELGCQSGARFIAAWRIDEVSGQLVDCAAGGKSLGVSLGH